VTYLVKLDNIGYGLTYKEKKNGRIWSVERSKIHTKIKKKERPLPQKERCEMQRRSLLKEPDRKTMVKTTCAGNVKRRTKMTNAGYSACSACTGTM
jgi:hypothetical protein